MVLIRKKTRLSAARHRNSRTGDRRPRIAGARCGPPRGTVSRTHIPTETGDYRRYYENLREAILSGVPLEVTPQQAVNVMRGLELACESSQQKRTLPFAEL